MIDTFFNTLVKMSLQGVVMITIILMVRFMLKKLQINHKYLVGLWCIVFFYLAFPGKISVPIGFWGNGSPLKEMQVVRKDVAEDSADIIQNNGAKTDDADITQNNSVKADGVIAPNKSINKNTIIEEDNTNAIWENRINTENLKSNLQNLYILLKSIILPYVWLFIFIGLLTKLLFSYFRMKQKLLLSIPYAGKIWWAEEIDTPMVYGLLNPKIYLPLSVKKEDLTYIIVHEAMHIRRKDYLMKMLAYMICLLHWFNPLVWLAYRLLGEDIEKACDEAVVQSMEKEKRKEYAYALLRFSSGDHTKKKVFVAPVCFDEGDLKARIQNIMKYKSNLPKEGGFVVKLILILVILFMTKSEITNIYVDSESPLYEKENLPEFYVSDLEELQIAEEFSLEDYYITNRYTWENHFYIDESGNLWATGGNEYGQLGTGTYGYEEEYEEPVKIAEQVVSVDASDYGYFCIYLTENGNLYGVGLNYREILLGKGSEQTRYSSKEECLIHDDDYQKVLNPVLLMENVAYARAGDTSIVVLQKDKTAYWWGEYHKDRPENMYSNKPIKVMENCRYITTDSYNGAAISEDGELYTWGWNILGACGTEIAEDEFVRTPVKVLEDVKMVWVDGIGFNDSDSEDFAYTSINLDYPYNIFALTNKGEILAAGIDAGNKERVAEIAILTGIAEVYQYSDRFVPVRIVE